MAIDTQAIVNALATHAAASGHFERVNGAEIITSPGTGLTAAVWVDRIDPAPEHSGLASTSVRLALNVRIYTSAIQQPRDAIDPRMMAATDALMAAYSADFTLGDRIAFVDLMGAHGLPLQAAAGYTDIQGTPYRVMTITVPAIVSDTWTQEP